MVMTVREKCKTHEVIWLFHPIEGVQVGNWGGAGKKGYLFFKSSVFSRPNFAKSHTAHSPCTQCFVTGTQSDL